MKFLQYCGPGHYEDRTDGRIVLAARPMYGLENSICIKKAMLPSDCPMGYTGRTSNPMDFFIAAKTHPCYGTYWHAHFGIEEGRIAPTGIDDLEIDEMVKSGNAKVEINPLFRPSIVEVLESLGEDSPEEYFIQHPLPFSSDLYRMRQEDPYTFAYYTSDGTQFVLRIRRHCGSANNRIREWMTDDVQQQFEAKYRDIERLLADLYEIELSEVPKKAEALPEIEECLFSEAIREEGKKANHNLVQAFRKVFGR